MCNISIDLLIKDKSWKSHKEINKILMEDVFKSVMNYLKIPMWNNTIEISVNLTDDENIRNINRDYRHIDKTTNVLSFSLYDKKSSIINDLQKIPFVSLGDIIFSYDTIKKEAEEQNKTFTNHFIHMLIHSYLHLLGYDHMVSKERKEMEAMEIEILNLMNICNPYIC